jgi:hypothetical protein
VTLRGIKKLRGPALGAIAATLLLGSGIAVGSQHWLITSTAQIKPSVLKLLQGATGPAGAAGQDGAQGPVGPQGPAGQDATVTGEEVTGPTGGFDLSDIHYRPSGNYVDVPAGDVEYVSAKCDDGEYVIGGGDYGYGIEVEASYPDHSWTGDYPEDDEWEVQAVATGPYTGEVEAYAVCASSS